MGIRLRRMNTFPLGFGKSTAFYNLRLMTARCWTKVDGNRMRFVKDAHHRVQTYYCEALKVFETIQVAST
jgi:hypothetical protein